MTAFFLLVGAWAIPFVFESSSILYKFGMDKLLFRSGKIFGFTLDRLDFHIGDGKFYNMGAVGKDVDILVAIEAGKNK